MTSPRSLILLTKDLFFIPVIRTIVEEFGLELLVATSAQWQPSTDAIRPLASIVDLGSISLPDLPEIAGHLDKLTENGGRCAYGSHVHTIRLQRAAETGFAPVLAKGQVQNALPSVVKGWVESSKPPSPSWPD